MKRPRNSPPEAAPNELDASLFAEPAESSVRPSRAHRASDALRSRLMESIGRADRYGHLAPEVAAALDLDAATAAALLESAADPARYTSSPFEGVTHLHVDGGPRVANAITGFVRIVGGGVFPTHHHLGTETILILHGSCLVEETGEILRSGDTLVSGPRDVHAVIARPGPDLVYLVVARGGIRVGETTFLPGDPSV